MDTVTEFWINCLSTDYVSTSLLEISIDTSGYLGTQSLKYTKVRGASRISILARPGHTNHIII